MERSKYGLASCLVFGLVLLCIVSGDIGMATLPPSSGGDFPAGFGQALLSGAFMLWGWGLSFLGCGLAIAGMMQKGKSATLPAIGLGLNVLVAAAGALWILSQP